jgi:hypothetical protein
MIAGDAADLPQGKAIGRVDLAVVAAVQIAPAANRHDFAADAHTPPAKDTASAEMSHVRVVAGIAGQGAAPAPRHHVDQILVRVVLQATVARRLAHGAIERMVAE